MQTIEDNCCLEDIGQLIQRLVRVVQIYERDEFKKYGLTTSQCYTLIHIKDHPQHTMQSLSEKMNLDKSTMTRILNILERDGYLMRYKDQYDKRVVIPRLTEKGILMEKKLKESTKAYYMKIVNHLPKGQVSDVLNSVSLMVSAFQKANPKCC